MKPKISVVLTIYNAEKYLFETIESILNQSFKDFELIAVNDKSTDNSLKIIRGLLKKDKRIILVNNRNNVGPTTSLNIGLNIAKGKYIAISDHDDISLPRRLETEYNFLEKNKDIFLVGSGAININEQGEELNMFLPIVDINKINKEMLCHNCFYHPTIMFRNEQEIKYREKIYYAHDLDFYLNLLSAKKKIINIPDILVKYRIHSGQLSVLKRAQQYLFAQKAKEFYHQRLRSGKDDYDSFDPTEILNFDIEKSNDPKLLEVEIHSNFKLGNYKKSIKFCKKYIQKNGLFNKIGIYSILSYLGNKSKFFHKLNQFLLSRA